MSSCCGSVSAVIWNEDRDYREAKVSIARTCFDFDLNTCYSNWRYSPYSWRVVRLLYYLLRRNYSVICIVQTLVCMIGDKDGRLPDLREMLLLRDCRRNGRINAKPPYFWPLEGLVNNIPHFRNRREFDERERAIRTHLTRLQRLDELNLSRVGKTSKC